MFGWFQRKKKPAVIPLPPERLPSFPAPEELDEDMVGPLPGEEELPSPPRKAKQSKGPIPTFPQEFLRPIMREDEEPLFLNVESYQTILDTLGYARTHLDRSGRMVARLEELSETQKSHLNHVHDTIHDAHEKLLFLDELLFKKR